LELHIDRIATLLEDGFRTAGFVGLSLIGNTMRTTTTPKHEMLNRREVLLALASLPLLPVSQVAHAQRPAVRVRTLNHIHLNVSDLQRSLRFYQELFGLRLQGNQGVEIDWAEGVIPILGIGDGTQFISFSERKEVGPEGRIDHFGFGVEFFDADQIVADLLSHGIRSDIRIRRDSDPPVPELKFNDPDGVIVQIQDISYCGGSGTLGNQCSSATPPPLPPIPVRTLNHIHLPVSNIQESLSFYQGVLGMEVQAEQGIESDWTTPIIFMLGIGGGPAFVSFSGGSQTGTIDHFCFGMDHFNAEQVAQVLAEHGLEPNIRIRRDSDPAVPELKFNDPDGIIVQIQDSSYCGGSGALGNVCDR